MGQKRGFRCSLRVLIANEMKNKKDQKSEENDDASSCEFMCVPCQGFTHSVFVFFSFLINLYANF